MPTRHKIRSESYIRDTVTGWCSGNANDKNVQTVCVRRCERHMFEGVKINDTLATAGVCAQRLTRS
jgi:hypothetical protein